MKKIANPSSEKITITDGIVDGCYMIMRKCSGINLTHFGLQKQKGLSPMSASQYFILLDRIHIELQMEKDSYKGKKGKGNKSKNKEGRFG